MPRVAPRPSTFGQHAPPEIWIHVEGTPLPSSTKISLPPVVYAMQRRRFGYVEVVMCILRWRDSAGSRGDDKR